MAKTGAKQARKMAGGSESEKETRRKLKRLGWWWTPRGWRRPGLRWPWPTADADRLEKDRAAGDYDAVQLLGEIQQQK